MVHAAAAGHSSYQVVNRVAPIVRLQAGQVQVDDFVLDTSGMGKQVSSWTSCGSAAGKRCSPNWQGGRVVLGRRSLPCVPAHPLSTHMLRCLAQEGGGAAAAKRQRNVDGWSDDEDDWIEGELKVTWLCLQ